LLHCRHSSRGDAGDGGNSKRATEDQKAKANSRECGKHRTDTGDGFRTQGAYDRNFIRILFVPGEKEGPAELLVWERDHLCGIREG